MREKLLKILFFTLPLALLIFSGCVWQKTAAPSADTIAPTSSVGFNSDTSTWKTFTDDEFGLSFKIPEEWQMSHDVDEPNQKSKTWRLNSSTTFSLNIFRYDKSPETTSDEGDGLDYRKIDLANLKKEMESDNRSEIAGRLLISRSFFSTPPGGDLLYKFSFFKNNDLVELYINLPLPDDYIMLPIENGKREHIASYIDNLEKGIVDTETKTRVDILDMIVSTIGT